MARGRKAHKARKKVTPTDPSASDEKLVSKPAAKPRAASKPKAPAKPASKPAPPKLVEAPPPDLTPAVEVAPIPEDPKPGLWERFRNWWAD